MNRRAALLLGLVAAITISAADPLPSRALVPDEETAIQIAVAVWVPVYGRDTIEGEKPYRAKLRDGVWFVSGTLPSGMRGGTAEAEISQFDAKVLRIGHGK